MTINGLILIILSNQIFQIGSNKIQLFLGYKIQLINTIEQLHNFTYFILIVFFFFFERSDSSWIVNLLVVVVVKTKYNC